MRKTAGRLLRGFRIPILALLDASAWFAAVYLAAAMRFETLTVAPATNVSTAGGNIPLYGVVIVATIAVACHLLAAWAFRLHQGRTTLGSFEELFLLASVLVGAGTVATVLNALLVQPLVPRTTPISAAFIAIAFCAWPRALWRILMNQSQPRNHENSAAKIIVAGAGDGGRELVRSMQRDPLQQWQPVAFVDDDPRKKHFRHRGVGVLGSTQQMSQVASRTGASTVVIAIPSADSETIKRINDQALDAALDVKVLPSVNELLSGVHHSAVRDLKPEDLLGRHQVSTDVESIAGYLAGKRVLVTGAGGSIGSELCRQIARFAPASLIMLDRDESALHSLLLSISGRADLELDNVVLANIRELDRVQQVFDHYRPEVVFHAAALKHVNMLEGHAAEAIQTNVLGTLNLLEAAASHGVERFVNISTDKAADPVNVLGYTKRLAESLTASFATRSSGIFLSVRFGNVLGTSGSVLRTFGAQIKAGGPVTVTDREVTRYFMTVDEAVQLVIQAAAIGRDGEALVLDMGEPVRIVDVATQMIEQSRRPVDVVFTGLKHGEKLHEVLFGTGEDDVRPMHPLVSHVRVPQMDPTIVRDISLADVNDALVRTVAEMCQNGTASAQRHPQ
ncbi:MAG: polysaccharide biosynthesis protein [Kineosporiaceae bacterium]|nr:polysaccharide biosynthesis protein [Aeromicrobium sp.]